MNNEFHSIMLCLYFILKVDNHSKTIVKITHRLQKLMYLHLFNTIVKYTNVLLKRRSVKNS